MADTERASNLLEYQGAELVLEDGVWYRRMTDGLEFAIVGDYAKTWRSTLVSARVRFRNGTEDTLIFEPSGLERAPGWLRRMWRRIWR
jgi:hypothetical protein